MKRWYCILALAGAAAAQTPTVSPGGILNAASFDKSMPVTPGSLIAIFGSNLAATTATADSIPLSTVLGNVSVTINGVPAPELGVFHTSGNADQLNVQLPWNVQAGTAQVVVTNNGAVSQPQNVQVGPASPGIFSVNFGTGQAIAINPDSSLAAPAGSIPGLTTRPAKIGDPLGVIILATGLGAVTPTVANGANSLDTLRTTVTTPVVLVGGVPAQVTFSGLSPNFVGVNQVNILLPPGTPTGDRVSLQIQVGGMTSTDQVTMAVSQ